MRALTPPKPRPTLENQIMELLLTTPQGLTLADIREHFDLRVGVLMLALCNLRREGSVRVSDGVWKPVTF